MLAILFLLFGLIAYSPGFQTFLANQVTNRLSSQLGTKVSIERIHLRFLDRATVHQIYIEDYHNDTLLYAQKLDANIAFIQFGKLHFSLRDLSLERPLLKVYKYPGEEAYDYATMLSVFEKDTTQSETVEFQFDLEEFALLNGNVFLDDKNDTIPEKAWNGIRLDIEDISVSATAYAARISELSLCYNNRICLNEFSGGFLMDGENLKIEKWKFRTDESSTFFSGSVAYSHLDSLFALSNEVQINLDFEGAQFDADELRWATEYYKLNERIHFKGRISGTPQLLKGDDFDIKVGEKTSLVGNWRLMDITDTVQRSVVVNVEKLYTNRRFVNEVFSVYKLGDVPEQVNQLEFLDFSGFINAGMNDVSMDSRIATALGSADVDVMLRNYRDSENAVYNGAISLTNFQLDKLLGEDFGKTSLNLKVRGKGLSANSFDVEVEGTLPDIYYSGYDLKNAKVKGTARKNRFSGFFEINDKIADLTFNGLVDLSQKDKLFNFTADVRKVDLAQLNILQTDTIANASMYVEMDFKGPNFDEARGDLIVEGITLETTYDYNYISDFEFHSKDSSGYHLINITSAVLDGRLSGNFGLVKTPSAVVGMIQQYYKGVEFSVPENLGSQQLAFDIEVKSIDPITRIFSSDLLLEPGMTISGLFDSGKPQLIAQISSDGVAYQDYRVHNFDIQISNTSRSLKTNLNAEYIDLAVDHDLYQPEVALVLRRDTAFLNANWWNKAGTVRKGDLHLYSTTRDDTLIFGTSTSSVYILDSVWNIHNKGRIEYASDYLFVDGLALNSGADQIAINGEVVDAIESSKLRVSLSDFGLHWLDPLIKDPSTKLTGKVRGDVDVLDLFKKPYVLSALNVDSLKLNGEYLGELSVGTNWEKEQSILSVNGDMQRGNIQVMRLAGAYYANSPDKRTSLRAHFEKFKVMAFQPYTSSFLDDLKGFVGGDIELSLRNGKGSLLGELELNKTSFHVPLTNVVYNIDGTHKVVFTENAITFDNVKVMDPRYQTRATASGKVSHRQLKNWAIDLEIETDSLFALNTDATMNDSYYGRAFATGSFEIHGAFNRLMMDITARTEKGTSFSIPLSGSSEVSNKNFIQFVKKDETNALNQSQGIRSTKSSSIEMEFNIEVTSDAVAELIFDPTVGDIMRGKGYGNLRMVMNKEGEIFLWGDYNVTSGDYLFTLQNLINKKFEIQRGGLLRWDGDPYDASIDLTASYNLRTSLNPLQISDSSRTKQAVRLDLHLTNNLMNPNIGFDVLLPNSNSLVQEEVNQILRNDENEMNRQVFSLLIMNSFLTPEYANNLAGGNYLNQGLANNTAEMLSNQLSRWVSQIDDRFDLGVNYEQGTEFEQQQVELALSTQLFNDRVTINGNLGVPIGNESTSSQLVGDVEVEVRISQDGNFRARAFNRSTQFDPLVSQYNYRQGVGIIYRTEFNSLDELKKKVFGRDPKEEESSVDNP